MKLFIDTGKLEEIREANAMGILDGVTTNPSLIKSSGATNLKEHFIKILQEVKGKPVSLEVISNDYEGMVREGLKLKKLFGSYGNLYVKVPVNPVFGKADNHYDGIKAIRNLSSSGVKINCTLVFTPEQALMAAKAGASFVSPFAGRVDDFIRSKARLKFKKTDYYPMGGLKDYDDDGVVSGIDLVAQIVEIFKEYGVKCEVLAASLRNTRQFREAALVGAHIATAPLYVIKEALIHSKTIEGMVDFTKDIIPEYRKLLQ